VPLMRPFVTSIGTLMVMAPPTDFTVYAKPKSSWPESRGQSKSRGIHTSVQFSCRGLLDFNRMDARFRSRLGLRPHLAGHQGDDANRARSSRAERTKVWIDSLDVGVQSGAERRGGLHNLHHLKTTLHRRSQVNR
jgi:hypothetical protein